MKLAPGSLGWGFWILLALVAAGTVRGDDRPSTSTSDASSAPKSKPRVGKLRARRGLAVSKPEPKPTDTPAASSSTDTPAASSSTETPASGDSAAKKEDAPAGEKPKEDEKPKKPPIQVATFGGGCFWSIEAVFDRVPGVISAVSGFSGGNVPYPSYQLVCTGTTGHAEVVHVTFDSRKVTYEQLLRYFWKAHDPTTPNAQGDDYGPQYRSIILYHDDEQREAAIKVHKEMKTKKAFHGTVVTQLVPFRAFFPAEAYHQDYATNHPADAYTQAYIVPKIWKLKLK